MNNYSEFQVNTFSNNEDIRKCQFSHDAADEDARAMTIPQPTAELQMEEGIEAPCDFGI